ncbi:Uric acid degradation bifunctional protein TTL [Arachis hypogaea]|nr:Uric acid degradation bifunctional protein TTL [Arachis hypogaea]
MNDFSSCCSSPTFTTEMAVAAPFSLLEHAIAVARDIWFRKVNVRCWLEAISGRSCFKEYLKKANNYTRQELHKWGSMYEKRFGYTFVTCASEKSSSEILAELKTRFRNDHVVELDIASKEEMKYIELHITDLLSKRYAQSTNKGDGEVVKDSLDGIETDSAENLDEIFSVRIDISMQSDNKKVLEEDKETFDNQQIQDHVYVAKGASI